MKIAILSDIHGNLAALQAVTDHLEQWQPDQVVVAGDTVNRGPQSVECWQWIQTKAATAGWQIIKGNHEDYVIAHQQTAVDPSHPEAELGRLSSFTYAQLNGAVDELAALPDMLTLADGRVRICHASMRHNRDGLYAEDDQATLAAKIAPAPAVFATAHTHKPFIRAVNDTLVVNAGSVGTPADGDWRASYAQVMQRNGRWQATIQRIPYHTAHTVQAYTTSGLLHSAAPFSWLIYYEWQLATYLIPNWMAHYWPHVLTGEWSMRQSVDTYLTQLGLATPTAV